jgi:aminomethyltransferase
MKETAFTKYHVAMGARMAPFAGYLMPIEFTGINNEHLAVRERAGLFDVSHMGEIWVKGPNALAFLQHVSTNDASALVDGKIQYTCSPNGRGGIVDDYLIYRVDAQTYLLVVNAANVEKDWDFFVEHGKRFNLRPGIELYNASDEIAQLALQGPDSLKILQKICNEPIEDMAYYTFRKVTVAGVPEVIVSATGYTGEKGVEIYMANADADTIWQALWQAGEEYGMQPVGLGARDTLRLEMGFCLYGNDIDDTTSPLEAGLGWITKFADGKDFIDRRQMEVMKAEGVERRLVGFEMIDRGIPRHDYEIADAEGRMIGRVTSGTQSPMLKTGIGLGYVQSANAVPGTEIYIVVRGKNLKARVLKPPFYKK